MHARAAVPGRPRTAGWQRALAVLVLASGLGWVSGSSALSVGDLEVRSMLGDPLEAIVRLEAAAGEAISRACFSQGSAFAAMPDMPVISDVRFLLVETGGAPMLRVLSETPVREPLSQVVLQVRCPGLPRITRAFVVMLNPGFLDDRSQPSRAAFIPAVAGVARTRAATGSGIAPGSRYVVRNGDTVSGIADRIEGRPAYSVWPLAARIFELNPGAFENGRMSGLVAGATVTIPDTAFVRSAGGRGGAGTLPAVRRDIPAPGVSGTNDAGTGTDVLDDGGLAVISADAVVSGERPARLEYLVLSTSLSSVSRQRIRQRVATAPGTAREVTGSAFEGRPEAPAEDVAEPEPAAQAVATPSVRRPEAPSSLMPWLIALSLGLLIAVAAVSMIRRREASQYVQVDKKPWELEEAGEDEEALTSELEPKVEMSQPGGRVYDDFDGTFVPIDPVHAPAPEDAGQPDEPETRIMPAGTETAETVRMPSTEQSGLVDPDWLQPEDPMDTQSLRITERKTDGSDIDEVSLDPDDPMADEGWVELDFESTQILEQDYLAEYAATLRERVKEQSGRHPSLADVDDEDDVLLEASELIDELSATEGESALRLEDDTGAETTPLSLTEDNAQDTSAESGDTADDTRKVHDNENVVTLDAGKRGGESAADEDEADAKDQDPGQVKGRKNS